MDEFTSVVDRTVAKIASHSVEKAFRKSKKKFVAISCHYDIIEWLQPDWIIDLENFKFRRRLRQSRPKIEIEIRKGSHKDWGIFKHHHYMNNEILKAAQVLIAYHNDRKIAFAAYRHVPHPKFKNLKMGHRTVVIPDYQGLKIGLMLDNYIGSMLKKQNMRYRNRTAHPAMIKSYLSSDKWVCVHVGRTSSISKTSTILKTRKQVTSKQNFSKRITAAFEYIGD